ncbi:MAG: excinuclease ABC subunit UvrC [archaeon]|jgi:excinuclease ABC subunit C
MISPNEISFLPNSPGCYLFKDENDVVLYVGKAKDLKKRVSNYFQKKEHDPKTELLVTKIKKIDFVLVSTEVEALLLENNLIKKYYPHFNLDLKDSRRYAYIRVSGDELPWLEVARIRNEKGEYFGPFVSGSIRKVIMDTVSRNFKVLTQKPSPQLRKLMNKEEYNKRVNQVKKILKGNVDELIEELEKNMKENSEKNNFEYAITLRNQIAALKTLKERQRVEFTKTIDAHVINYTISAGEVHLLLFNVRKGVVEDKQEFVFPEKEDFLEEFLVQFYDESNIPQEIILPVEVNPTIQEYLTKKVSEKEKRKVQVIVPKSGEKKELLEFVSKNITATFFAGSERITELQKALGLEKVPHVIECFDISHLSGTNTVASMVSFKDGFPNKSEYRKFKIRAETNNDDLMAMREAVERRYSGSLSKTMRNPDLIVIDGGPTQLGVASEVLQQLKLNIPIISLAKQFEEIYRPDRKFPIKLDKKHKGLQMLQAIRDEAHRFANAYRKVLKRKEVFGK